MGFRFGKRIKICKGINLNVSSKGVGISAGVKGFRVSTGPTGSRITTSLPGTGISYTETFSNSSRGRKYTYSEIIENAVLGKEKIIRANSEWELRLLKEDQLEKWRVQEDKYLKKEKIKDLKLMAELKTEEAENEIKEYLNILNHTLEIDDKLDWDTQKNYKKYPTFIYSKKEPTINEFILQLNVPMEKKIMEFFFKKIKKRRIFLENKAKESYLQEYNKFIKDKQKEYQNYEIKKYEFYEEQKKLNIQIEDWKKKFELGEKEAVEKYIEVVFSNSIYPNQFEREYEIDYFHLEKKVLISLKISNPDNISKVKQYRYSPTKKEIVEKEMLKKEFSKYYKDIVFQTALRTVHEVYEGIYIKNILNEVTLNIWVETVNQANGLEELKCILSLECDRENFEKINLEKIDLEECLKMLGARYKKDIIKLDEIIPYFEIEE